MGSFEVFEHTADVGLRVRASGLEELFVEAARGVVSLVVENPEAVLPQRTETIDLDSENLEALFVDWLRELIYRIETEHMLWCEFNVQLLDGNRRLRAICRGEPADWTRHLPDNELKAVTYHGLRVEQMPNGWQAEVIFDI